ncbi:MAG: alpha/beta fold hydrolase [Solimonas sp.]
MPLVVYILGLMIFSLTTSEFMVAGMMPSLTQAFGVSVTQIGYLISLYAIGMVVGGPLLTVGLLKLRVPNKQALLWLLGFYAVAQSVAASAIVAGNQWEGMGRQVELDRALDVSQQIKRIAKPTLVIGCTHDHMVPPAHARALAAAISGACYAELDSGHLAPLERPDEFAQLVTDFLSTGVRRPTSGVAPHRLRTW